MESSAPQTQDGEFDPTGSVKPTDAQTVDQIKAYMDAHNLKYTTNTTKADLLKIVNGGGN